MVHGVSTYINAAAWFSKINSTLLFAGWPTRTDAPSGTWSKTLTAVTSFTCYSDWDWYAINISHSTSLGSAFIRHKISHLFPSQNHLYPLPDYRLPSFPFFYSYQTASPTLGYSATNIHLNDIPLTENFWASIRVSLFRFDGRETNSLTYQFQVQPPPP